MNNYKSKEFINVLSKKMNNNSVPSCPFCGGRKFTSTDKCATILIGDDIDEISFGQTIPSGMVICENCGHIDFFALGSLGFLKNKGVNDDGE